jgi:hypothetical protein
MTATVHFMTKTHNRAVVKVVGTTSTDTATINLKTTISITATGDLTVDGTARTITRASGSWATDGVIQNAVVSINGTQYSVLNVSTNVITVYPRYKLTSGVITGATVTSYKSDLLVGGQVIDTTAHVGITNVAYSVSSSGDVTVVRNSKTVFKLFGHDTLVYGSNEESGYDIVVTFNTSAGGTCILELSKTSGFGTVNPSEIGY